MTTYVYIIAEDDFSTVVKVGITNNPEKRLRDINTAWLGHKPARLIHTMQCASRSTAREVERATLKRLKLSGIKVRGEKAWCAPAVAYGHLVLAFEVANHIHYEEVQYAFAFA